MKILQAMVYSIICLIGMVFSTQWSASSLRYAAWLGEPLIVIGKPIYWPWSFFKWSFSHGAAHPDAFNVQILPIMISIIVAYLTSVLLSLRLKKKINPDSYGSAKWAEESDIKKTGLFGEEGVVLGAIGKHFLQHNGPENCLLVAPTRSGKGVGLIIPTSLTWKESMVVFDPKGEIWEKTSGFRSSFSHCIYFDPTSKNSARFNPLLEVRRGENEVRDSQNIADILVDPNGTKDERNHWDRAAHSLLTAAILHVLYCCEDKSLGGVANCLANPEQSLRGALETMMLTLHLGDKAHPVVASLAREMQNKAEEELSGVFSTAMSYLGLYRDPLIARNTSASDFRILDLMQAQHPVSLYIVVPPSDVSRTKSLIRLLVSQMLRILTERLNFTAGSGNGAQHRLLLMLDEFCMLGRLQALADALPYTAGYGIKTFLVSQSFNQIEGAYGNNNSIIDNCHVRVVFAANDERTAKRISEQLGQQTLIKEQQAISGERAAILLKNRSVSFQEFGRPLLMPSEIIQMDKDKALIFVSGCPPILADKIRYFDERSFISRLHPPVSLSDGDYADKPTARPHDWVGMGLTHPIHEVSHIKDVRAKKQINFTGASL